MSIFFSRRNVIKGRQAPGSQRDDLLSWSVGTPSDSRASRNVGPTGGRDAHRKGSKAARSTLAATRAANRSAPLLMVGVSTSVNTLRRRSTTSSPAVSSSPARRHRVYHDRPCAQKSVNLAVCKEGSSQCHVYECMSWIVRSRRGLHLRLQKAATATHTSAGHGYPTRRHQGVADVVRDGRYAWPMVPEPSRPSTLRRTSICC